MTNYSIKSTLDPRIKDCLESMITNIDDESKVEEWISLFTEDAEFKMGLQGVKGVDGMFSIFLLSSYAHLFHSL
jgi:hypothetical protein